MLKYQTNQLVKASLDQLGSTLSRKAQYVQLHYVNIKLQPIQSLAQLQTLHYKYLSAVAPY
ncbi:hypothetical protein CH330_01445 [candidate division WOR-3 bacterium JGI_Cruoil_03_51_56]|uniref:Uncharacterized protein n=1 Tax=candidate division WOR-3 bacterium JGI_Cruoil_03_51_56 TaxID=1973747 RepID=A0A235BXI4_UNCW3|nr:MAG: hypothetical protein CH330_01445 [candidate division WOR-3 bacterium JGI_Cruoil_03_51_56]